MPILNPRSHPWRWWGPWLLGAPLLVLGCGTGAPRIPPELLGSEGGSQGSPGYPEGPFGTRVGDIIANLRFRGVADPSRSSETTWLEFQDFYEPNGEERVLLLNTAAVWCQPCQVEHQDLPERVRRLGPRGLRVLSMIYQDADGGPPTSETLRVWAQTFDTNFALALDPEFEMGRFGPADTPPLNVVVNARSMKILAIFLGNQDEALWSFVESALTPR